MFAGYIYICIDPVFFCYPVRGKYSTLPSLGKIITSYIAGLLACSYKTGLARGLYIIFQFIEITKIFIHKKIHKMKKLFKILRNQQKMAITLMEDNIDNEIKYCAYRVQLSHIRFQMYQFTKLLNNR